jgi:hypothetical protein
MGEDLTGGPDRAIPNGVESVAELLEVCGCRDEPPSPGGDYAFYVGIVRIHADHHYAGARVSDVEPGEEFEERPTRTSVDEDYRLLAILWFKGKAECFRR